MSGTHGLDGWTVDELQQLPILWWDQMAEVFELIERTGDWPEGLTRAAVPLRPKEEGKTKPNQQRPITILLVLYRAWAGLRYDDLAEWQAEWTEDVMFGGMREREAVQAALEVTLDVTLEFALLAVRDAATAFFFFFLSVLPKTKRTTMYSMNARVCARESVGDVALRVQNPSELREPREPSGTQAQLLPATQTGTARI